MPTVAHRMEEDALGALLYEPDRLADVPVLRPEHFNDSEHRMIFDALMRARVNQPEARGDQLLDMVAQRVRHPSVSADCLTGLAFACSDPSAAINDCRLVIAQAVRRELGQSAQRIQRLTEPLAQTFPDLNYSALLHMMRRYEVSTGPDINPSLPSEPNGQHPHIRDQEIVLAGLIQDREAVTEFSAWLPAEAFTAPNRRDIYQAVLAIDGLADPPSSGFDLPGQIEKARTTIAFYGPSYRRLDQYSAILHGSYITYLGLSATTSVTAPEAGRNLVADLTRTELAATSTLPVDRATHATHAVGPGPTAALDAEPLNARLAHDHAHIQAPRPTLSTDQQIRQEPPF